MRSPESANRQIEVSQMGSLRQPSAECVQQTPEPLPLATEYCLELLQALNNTFALVLMNAQVLDGKLPSYSRSKRYVHEIERSAQRGGALLKRLLDRLSADVTGACDKEFGAGRVSPEDERTAVVASQGPNASVDYAVDFAPSAAHAAPDFVAPAGEAHRGL